MGRGAQHAGRLTRITVAILNKSGVLMSLQISFTLRTLVLAEVAVVS